MKRPIILLLALVALACLSPTDGCGCTPALGIGIVAGVVTRGDGAPAAGAEVRVEARVRSCALSERSSLVDPPTTHADDAGRYRYQMRTIVPSDTACVRLVAHAAEQPSGDSAVVDGIRMRLISSYGTRARPESLRVDLRLR